MDTTDSTVYRYRPNGWVYLYDEPTVILSSRVVQPLADAVEQRRREVGLSRSVFIAKALEAYLASA